MPPQQLRVAVATELAGHLVIQVAVIKAAKRRSRRAGAEASYSDAPRPHAAYRVQRPAAWALARPAQGALLNYGRSSIHFAQTRLQT